MTEGTGHVIDPAGDARRALQDAVTAHGPEVLSDATVMEHLCRTQLTALPGECILIVSAARADVPALLRDDDPATRQLRCHPVRRHHPGRGARPGRRREPVGGARVRPCPRPDRAGRNPVDAAPRAGGSGAGAAGERRGGRGSAAGAVRCGRPGGGATGAGGRARGERGRHWGAGQPGDAGRDRELRGRGPGVPGGRVGLSSRRGWRGDPPRDGGRGRAPGRGGRPGPSCSTATRWG